MLERCREEAAKGRGCDNQGESGGTGWRQVSGRLGQEVAAELSGRA